MDAARRGNRGRRGSRWRWSDGDKARMVSESLVAGAKVNEVAHRHGVTAQQLSSWRALSPARVVGAGAGAGILGPVDPGAVCNRGAPSGETTLDGRPASALEPLRRILAVCLDEGVGDGVDEVGVRGHVALPCEALLPVTSMALSRALSMRPASPRLDSGRRRSGRMPHVAGRRRSGPSVFKGDGREMQEGRPEARSGCPGRLRDLWLQRNEGRKGSRPAC